MKEQLIMQQVKYSELNQQNQLLDQSYAELKNKYSDSISLSESLKDNVKQLEMTNIEYQQTSQHYQNQCNYLQEVLEKKTTEIIVLQGDNKLLNHQLIEIKDLLGNAQAQNKLLINEKWELSQERARLEGQIKQMEKIID